MTKIKLCGLSRQCDIELANGLKPEYIGFVFFKKSHRYITPERAKKLKKLLDASIKAVGVFINEAPEAVSELLNDGVIDIAQLHGGEDEDYIKRLRLLTDKPIIKAFRITHEEDVRYVNQSTADHVLLDSGAGTGRVFNWGLIESVDRPYFLAGGLDADNVNEAVRTLHPYAVDVSSGIETDGIKDKTKTAAFVCAVRKADRL